jgi:serine/threonine protein kinase
MKLAWRHAAPPDVEEGTRVGGYKITRLVGPRGTAEFVYDARARDGTHVSVVVSAAPLGDRDDRARFRRLARLRAQIDHPGLLRVHRYGEHAGAPYVVTDPYPRATLCDVLRGRPLSPERTLKILTPAAEALDLCHGVGLVHQDLTDKSLLLDGDKLLLDTFGVTAPGREEIWGGGIAARDFYYATPEGMRGDPLVAASNVYSLAALLVHLITGRPPYEGPQMTLAYAHLAEPPPRPSERMARLGDRFDGVIAWGMAKEPYRRPPSATALIAAAADALDVTQPATRTGLVELARSAARARAPSGRSKVDRRRSKSRTDSRAGRLPVAVSTLAVLGVAAVSGVVAGVITNPFDTDSSARSAPSPDARVIARLDDRRAKLRAELADALLPQEQSAAAAALASSYDEVAKRAKSMPVVRAAGVAGSAYARLSAAAEAGDPAEFAAASQAVEGAENRFASAAARAVNSQDERK